MRKTTIILLSILFIPLGASAERATYDTITNIYTVPFVRIDNATFTDVKMSCDPNNGYTCVLLNAQSQTCASGTYFNGKNGYSIRTSLEQDGIQFGGIQSGGIEPQSSLRFEASWISSPKDKNPYLGNFDLTQFEDNQAYGVIGRSAYSGFNEGDLIHVTVDSEAYIITKVSDDTSLTFTKSNNSKTSNDCASSSDNYRGLNPGVNIDMLYNVNIVDTSSGSIQIGTASTNDRFDASGSGDDKVMGRYNSATVTDKSFTFDLFLPTDKMFMTDIGNGISVTTFDAESGKVKSTAVFMQIP